MNKKPLYIYLDQNHWIDLARAHHKHPDGEKYQEVFQTLIKLTEKDIVRLPLSFYHFVETLKIKNQDRKEKLAQTMTLLSKGWGMALVDDIAPIEIQKASALLFNHSIPTPPKIFVRDISLIFGIDPKKILDRLSAITGFPIDFLQEHLPSLVHTPENLYSFLTGNAYDEKEFEKGINGYLQGIKHFSLLNKNARILTKPLNKKQFRKTFISDYFTRPDTKEIFAKALAIYGYSLSDMLIEGNETAIAFFENIPSLNVESMLVTLRNIQQDKKIDENDWADLRYLMIALPYADIVVTENFWQDLIKKSKLDKKYQTVVLRKISELSEYI